MGTATAIGCSIGRFWGGVWEWKRGHEGARMFDGSLLGSGCGNGDGEGTRIGPSSWEPSHGLTTELK